MADILIYGIVGDPADKLDSATVTTAIRGSKGPLSVRINSPGGYVIEGLAIAEAIRSYPDRVTAYVDGLAASMASVIAMVADDIVMAETALMMIHKPQDGTFGDAPELRKCAEQLDRLEDQLIRIYAARTNLPEGDLKTMLAAETWFTAEEALAAGFATSIGPSLKIAAMADLSAFGFRHTPPKLKEPVMAEPTADTAAAVAAERTRVSTIMALSDKHNLPAAMATALIKDGIGLEQARAAILDHLAERSDLARIGHVFSAGETLDNPAFAAKAMGDALYARMSGKQPEGAAVTFAGTTMVDMARALVEARIGRSARTMRPEDVLAQAAWNGGRAPPAASGGWLAQGEITHTTSDFPELLTAAGQRFLMDVYRAAESPLKTIGRARTANDFRPIFGLQLSNFGTLHQVNEAGEIKHGTFSMRKESYKLETFGKQFGLSRQAIINDDLGAFSDVMNVMARAAAETEAQLLAALLNSNPVMDDGHPVFSAEHGNLGAAAAPSVDSLDIGRKSMRSMKDPDGVTPISAAPKYVLSAPGEETAIERLVSIPLSAVQVSETNPFAGKLTPLVDPRLTGTAWYLFADPAAAPVLEYANLNGFEGPQVEMQQGWDVLGQSYRVYADFGAGIVDHRGAYKFPATA